MKETHLEIVSIDKKVFEGSIVSLTVSTVDGDITVLPGHISLVTVLKAGELIARLKDGTTKELAIGGGFLMVESKKISVLAEGAEYYHELSEQTIEEAKAKAEKAIKEHHFTDRRKHMDALAQLERSIVQLNFIKKRHHRHHHSHS